MEVIRYKSFLKVSKCQEKQKENLFLAEELYPPIERKFGVEIKTKKSYMQRKQKDCKLKGRIELILSKGWYSLFKFTDLEANNLEILMNS